MNKTQDPQPAAVNQKRFHSFFEFNPLMCFIIDDQGVVMDVNALGAMELGFKREELLGLSVLNVFHPDDKERVKKHIKECLQKRAEMHSWELRKIKKNHEVIWVREVGRSIEDTDGKPVILISCENITVQRQIEEEMKNSKANLQAVIENTKDSIWSVDNECRILAMNTQFRNMFSLAFQERLSVGMNILEHIPDELKPVWKNLYQRTFRGEHFTVEQHYDFADISMDTSISFNPIVAIDGSITGAAVYARDITEMKKRESTMREIEERYRQMFDKNQAVKWLIDPNTGAIVDANSAAAEFYGYPLEKLKP